MPIKPGSLDDFAFSMAADMEAELNAMLVADGLPALPMDDTPDRRDRRRLFVAIARGVVRHLKSHEASLGVLYLDAPLTRTTNVVLDVAP